MKVDTVSRREALRLGVLSAGTLFTAGYRPTAAVSAEKSLVEVVRAPEGALQPQAVIDSTGTVHLVYLKGEARACDAFYTRRMPGKASWSAPLRINSMPNTAIAAGTIRGGQLALGKDHRVHVAWNGAGGHGSANGAPLFYAQLEPGAGSFTEQRNLLGNTADLDGGASIAADPKGNVYVAWHAATRKGAGEGDRRVWVAKSTDSGRTFAPEASIYQDPTGACACCSVKIFAESKGVVHVLYRAATEKVNRDMVYLVSPDGKTYRGGRIDPWVLNACPMSSESFVQAEGMVWAAWETEEQVRWAQTDGTTGKLLRHVSAPGKPDRRKHPFLAANAQGQVLLVWDEGTAWQRGGHLAWQLFDRDGKALPERGLLQNGIPVWGLATAVALPDGRFLVIH